MRPATATDTDCMLVLARFNSNMASIHDKQGSLASVLVEDNEDAEARR